ncbi:unnamed protein product [Pseudo-nitzschia multistriata]|uniref:Uncharacterized protein n=1 Tax=Pseudo-nitzschia multistriata TaxID=183589 RepID=A0A448ZI69_9STRA|nr:unnamed protein product [Pseudo-nitzschia multistriata]
MKSLEDNQKKTIKLDSYLCGPSDSGDPGRTYKIGQSFSICVGPSEDEKINYDYLCMVAFEEVTCGKIEVVEDGVETALTIVTTDPTNNKKADGASVGVGVLSFETVVTPKYYTGNSAEDEALVTCSGTVELVGFTKPLKFKKAGCRKTPLERGLNGPLFPLDNGGVESDAKQCNDFCKPTSETKYFLLDCPHFFGLGGDNYYECFCVDDIDDMNDTCTGEESTSSFATTKNSPCKKEYISSESKYQFDMGDKLLTSPVYHVNHSDRRLTASFSTNSGNLLQRHLQESGNKADTSGSFGTKVNLLQEDNADAVFGDLVAQAADTSAAPSTGMATAAGAVVAAAAALV